MNSDSSEQSRRDDEIDLAPYIAAVGRRRYLIAVITLACGAAMFAVTAFTAPTFKARAQLLVTSPRAADVGPTAPMSVETFVALVGNPTFTERAIQEARSTSASGTATISLDRVPDTEIVNIVARSSDRDFALNVANAVVEKAAALAGQLTEREIETTRSGIKSQLDRSRERLDEAEKKLAAVKKAGQDPEEARLQTEADVAREVYVNAATRYEQAPIDVSERSLRVQIVTRAVPPSEPVSPRTVRQTLVGLLAGFVLSLTAVLATVALRQASAR